MARYLVAAGMAEDPEQGYEYAQAAKRLAARVGVVREATGIAAYQAGRWAEALAELRAARRMTGSEDYVPLMADSERALGRLDRALALIREAGASTLDRATQIELRIVESGIRRDQGLAEAAVIALQVPELTSGRLRPWSARLFYAYADALLAAGRTEEAREAFARAAAIDADGETDAADRLDELDGVEFEDLAESEDHPEDGTAHSLLSRSGAGVPLCDGARIFQRGQDRLERLPEHRGLRVVHLSEDQPPDGRHVPGGRGLDRRAAGPGQDDQRTPPVAGTVLPDDEPAADHASQ